MTPKSDGAYAWAAAVHDAYLRYLEERARHWQEVLAPVMRAVYEAWLDATMVAVYGPCALCEGMGV